MDSNELDSMKVYFSQPNLNPQSKIGELVLMHERYYTTTVFIFWSLGALNAPVNVLLMNSLLKEEWIKQKELVELDVINDSCDSIEKNYMQYLKDDLKNCNLYFVDNRGYYVWIGNPKELHSIIDVFLSKDN